MLFGGLSATFGPGRTGLIGANGSGKSAVLRLAVGELTPTRGSVDVTGTLSYLPQALALRAGMRVDEALGIAGARRALMAIEEGDASPGHYATNNLDMASTRQLAQALSGYRGALIVASHDVPFLRDTGITRWLLLDGELSETAPP